MFPCTKCGQCCRHLDRSPIYADMHNGNGICKYLDGNLCSIYENRPIVCRIDDAFEVFFKDRMTREEYYELNKKSCELLRK